MVEPPTLDLEFLLRMIFHVEMESPKIPHHKTTAGLVDPTLI